MHNRHAFTLVELLVSVAIIVLLVSILIPSMERAVELARRAKCAANQHVLGVGSIYYTMQNKGDFPWCSRGSEFVYLRQNFAGVNWPSAFSSAGLFSSAREVQYAIMNQVTGNNFSINDYKPLEMWNCPGMKVASGYWDGGGGGTGAPEFMINFQYFGGIGASGAAAQQWRNPWGNYEPMTPIKSTTSRGTWALAAERNGMTEWSGNSAFPAWSADDAGVGQAPHRDWPNYWPEGGNQLYVDGSVEWVPFDDQIFINSWRPSLPDRRYYWFKQADLGDYRPPEKAYGRASKKPGWSAP